MANKAKIHSLRHKGEITKEVLLELGTDPDLEGFIITCKWKGGGYSVGWSVEHPTILAYSLIHMEHEIKLNLFGDSESDA